MAIKHTFILKKIFREEKVTFAEQLLSKKMSLKLVRLEYNRMNNENIVLKSVLNTFELVKVGVLLWIW